MDYQKAISNCLAMISFLRADRGEQIKTRQINRIREDTLKTAISAMQELEQYKQLGTLEDIKNLQSMEICNFEQLKSYRQIGSVREFRECKEILGKAYANELATIIDEYAEYRKLGTLEEVRAAVERLQPKAPNWHTNPVMENGKLPVCPTCNTIMVRTEILGRTIDEHCVTCGQAIDWSVIEC